MLPTQQPPGPADLALEAVRACLLAKPNLIGIVGKGLRQSFDEVIDGARTGRYRIEQLEKTEKTYIGTKVEIVLRNGLELERGKVLDNLIGGYEVDTKFSLTGEWMIPREAIGQICILVQGSDNAGTFSIGLARATDELLTPGSNQDGKKSVSAKGRTRITWLLRDQPLPRNFLLDLDDATREEILSQSSGMKRVGALFKNVTGQIIPRYAIEQLGRQKDPLRRARQMKETLAAEGFQILCATYEVDRGEFRRHGFTDFREDDWLSIPLG